MSLTALFAHLNPPVQVAAVVTRALAEDFGGAGDITGVAMIARGTSARGTVRARERGVVAGVPVAAEVVRQAAPGVRVSVHIQDGERVEAGQAVLSLDGPLAEMVAAERTLLNFLARMSGVATATARFVEAVAGTRAAICDTRKTTPGMRALEKYAVRCGGGVPHRIGLFDALLVKDNHIAGLDPAAMAARVAEAARAARGRWPLRFVMVECDRPEQFEALLALPTGTIDMALLDNMDAATLRRMVHHRDAAASAIRLEASGGVTLDRVRALAETGVDRISVGEITHSPRCLDMGLDIDTSTPPSPATPPAPPPAPTT